MANDSLMKNKVAYGLLRMPLALVELPLFVFLPTLYGTHLGLSLVVISGVLFLTRLIDAFADPLIGRLITRSRQNVTKVNPYLFWILCGLPVMIAGFITLLSPSTEAPWVSLGIGSILTFAGYSIVSIAYQSWGADVSTSDEQAAQLAGIREGFGLLGVITAAALLKVELVPWLLGWFSFLVFLGAIGLRWAPKPTALARSGTSANTRAKTSFGLLEQFKLLKSDQRFGRLLSVMLINGIATAIPATLVLFFVRDVIGARGQEPLFLMVYFIAGALGMPFWIWACKRIGLEATWLIGMVSGVLAFAWTVGLGAGDSKQFVAVCIVTGLALGADLAVPPAILARVIQAAGKGQSEEATYFGIWNFAIKFNLAAAAIISLPLIQIGGYRPGEQFASSPDTLALSIVYAALPCAMKLFAGLLLWVRPVLRVG
jgi:glycoside/pentoside/hexuronide:cation symporter, GPH family